MNDIMKTILSMSLSGSLLVLILLLSRSLLRDRIRKGWQYYLWLIVIARLLLPFTPQASLMGTLFMQLTPNTGAGNQMGGNMNLGGSGMYTDSSTMNPNGGMYTGSSAPNPDGGMYTDSSAMNPDGGGQYSPANSSFQEQSAGMPSKTLQEDSPAQSANQPGIPVSSSGPMQATAGALAQNLWLFWLGTALLLLMRKVTAYQSFLKYTKAGCREISDAALLDSLAQIGERIKVNKPVELYENSLVSSPMLLGLFRPCIVLPSASLPEQDLRHILLHELIHCKRWDIVYKWLVQLALCLHWFNPLAWLMGREINRACELACDEAVLQLLDEKGRHAYGDTLMHMLETGKISRNTPASVTLGASAKLLKERLGAILGFQVKSRWGTCASLLITTALACGFTFSGAYSKTPYRMPDMITAVDGTGNIPGQKNSLSQENSSNTGEAATPGTKDPKTDIPGKTPENASAQNQDNLPDNLSVKPPGRTYIYNYSQKGFYQAPYLFILGWNLLERDRKDHGSMELSLPDGSAMELLLHGSCKDFSQDTEAAGSLCELLVQLKAEAAGSGRPLTLPILISVRRIEGSTPLELAEQAYQDGSPIEFSAFYALLEEPEKIAFLDRASDDGHASLFSACLDSFNGDSTLTNRYLQDAYKNNRVSLFSVCLEHLPEDKDLIRQYAQKAYQDRKPAFFSVCLNNLAEDSEIISQYTQKAYEDGEVTFFSIALNYVEAGNSLINTLAGIAYENNETAFFSILAHNMDNAALEAWADRAFADKKVNFLSVLLPAFSDDAGGSTDFTSD